MKQSHARASSLTGGSRIGKSLSVPAAARRSSSSKSPPVAYGNSKNSLDAHLRDIKRQVDRSTSDPETIQLAGRLVSAKYDYTRDPRSKVLVPVVQAWGNYYRAPDGAACAMRDAYCEIQRMWDFLVLNVRYTFDQQEVDTFKTLKETLASGAEDCDGFVIAFAALLKSVGFRVVARVISSQGGTWDHIYTLVGCPHDNPKKWIPLDPTVDGAVPGWEYPNAHARQDFVL